MSAGRCIFSKIGQEMAGDEFLYRHILIFHTILTYFQIYFTLHNNMFNIINLCIYISCWFICFIYIWMYLMNIYVIVSEYNLLTSKLTCIVMKAIL